MDLGLVPCVVEYFTLRLLMHMLEINFPDRYEGFLVSFII